MAGLPLGQAGYTGGGVAKKGNDLLLGAELSFVAHQAFLIDVAQTKIEAVKSSRLTALDPSPNQQVVWPMGKICRKGGVKLVIQGVLPL